MIKRTYAVSYLLRPNKKTQGVPCVITLTFSGKIDQGKNWAKLYKTLCVIHRVNPTAIEIDSYNLTKSRLAIFDWVAALFKRGRA